MASLMDKTSFAEHLGGSYWTDRISAQIAFAARLSAVNGNKFNDIIEKAVDFLISEKEKNGAISNNAAKEAETILLPISETAKQTRVHAVSHAHIDMDWMWGFAETTTITVETFRTMLDLMNEYPEFTFSQSQASTYKIIEEYSPTMLPEIQQRVKEGRWEISASAWTETDKNMPNGESLARHILYTKNYLSDLFGLNHDDMQLDFEPDTFGHNISVPEILSRGGVKYYYHCRGYDKENFYRWRSRSGVEILVYREPKWYNADIDYKCFTDLPIFCDKYKIDSVLKVYGVGDHGGGPTRRDIENLIEMSKWPIMPTIIFSTYHKFFKELETYKDNLAVVECELNFVFTGCYTSQSRIKMANRIAEARLFETETLCAASNLLGDVDYGDSFKKAWENVLYNQFHDIIPGSGVTETREHALGQFQKTMAHVHANSSNALRYIAKNIDTSSATSLYSSNIANTNSEGGGVGFSVAGGVFNYLLPRTERGAGDARIFHLFNITQYKRKDVTPVFIWDWQHNPHKAQFKDTNGNPINCKYLGEQHYWTHKCYMYALETEIEAFSYKTYVLDVRSETAYHYAFSPDPRTDGIKDANILLENEYVRAEFDRRTLKLISYIEKSTNTELISKPTGYFKFINEDFRSSAWVIGAYMKVIDINENYNVKLTNDNRGGILQRFEYEISFMASKLKVIVSLASTSKTLEYTTEIDWREQSNREITPQIGFVVDHAYKASAYRYDIPFGTLDREAANDDRPAQTFVAAIPQTGNACLALINDTRYGYRCVNDSIYLNLLHTSDNPDQHPETDVHNIRIGITALPSCDNVMLFEESSKFCHPIAYVTNKPHTGNLPYSGSTLMNVEGKVKISSIKTPEKEKGNSLIIRLYDISGEDGSVILNFAQNVKKAVLVDINEHEKNVYADTVSDFKTDENKVTFNLKKYAVVTFKIVL